ncbi:hypothetical protein A3K73_06555 [Candidatus Pacearchaeota archaeon RBG_13_36_9]|nr:MAG: hypothetical protein A3K73_06555 [Candidatus Pacearchaeota archaeon RBG_13_36_9]
MLKINEIEKNRLDLAYRRNLQLLNIFLISGLGAVFAYIGALILNLEKVLPYTIIMILVGTVTYIFYKRIDRNLKEISERIEKLV